MGNNGRAPWAIWGILVAIGVLALVTAAWVVTAGPGRRALEPSSHGESAGLEPDVSPPAQDSGQPPPEAGRPRVQHQSKPHAIADPSATEPDLAEFEGPADAAGVRLVSRRQARGVALHFAARRWGGCRIGSGHLVFAPDGLPEAHFYVVCKGGAADVPEDVPAAELSALRRQRIKLEEQLARAPAGKGKELAARIKDLWRQMRGADSYATVVVGANNAREPFIASFGGLPPQVFLREDAIEVRRKQLGGLDPGEPGIIWLPPLFVAFEFPPKNGRGPSTYLEARGTELHEVTLSGWKRQPVPERLLQQRNAKWQSLSKTLE